MIATFDLAPRPPFRLQPTVRVFQRLPSNRVELWEDNRYWRVLPIGSEQSLVVVEDTGSPDNPRVRVTVKGGAPTKSELAALGQTLYSMLGMGVDLSPFYTVADQDPRLKMISEALRGLKPPHFRTLFETLVNSVVYQQISLAAGVSIANRIAERFGPALEVQGHLYHGWPAPETVAAASVEEVRATGLTTRRAEVLRQLAGLAARGDLSFASLCPLSSEEAIRVLDALPGLGRWSAELILLRGLGRLDVFPSDDAGARRGLLRLLGREEALGKGEEQKLAARFGNQRGYLYFLNLGWRLLQEGIIEPTRLAN